MSEVVIKRIELDKAELVVGLFDSYRVFYKQASDKELAQRFITERLTNNESVVFVAMMGGQPVGFTQLYPKYSSMRAVRNWILNDLYVDADQRKLGIGTKLIGAAREFAKDAGAKFVQLETAVDNYTAQSLYEGIGFELQAPDTEFLVYRISV